MRKYCGRIRYKLKYLLTSCIDTYLGAFNYLFLRFSPNQNINNFSLKNLFSNRPSEIEVTVSYRI
jgi:hypothetical protein